MTKESLARTIIKAHVLRESSWNGLRYQMSATDASKASSEDEDEQDLVATLLIMSWNDANSWANKVLRRPT